MRYTTLYAPATQDQIRFGMSLGVDVSNMTIDEASQAITAFSKKRDARHRSETSEDRQREIRKRNIQIGSTVRNRIGFSGKIARFTRNSYLILENTSGTYHPADFVLVTD